MRLQANFGIMGIMRIFAALLILAACGSINEAFAQGCDVSPQQVNLGETLRIICPVDFAKARFNDREIQLFLQPDGMWFGLMPVSVHDKPGPSELTISLSDDKFPQTLRFVILIRKTTFPTQNVKLSPEIEALHSTPEEMALLKTFKENVSMQRSWQDPLTPPVSGCMTSPFGVQRLHNGKPTGEYHGGVDQRTPEGEPIRAIAAGTINFAQKFNVLGNAVGIDHGQGLESMYLHMSRLEVQPGATVKVGDILGYAGSTGRSTGPHLHWVIYVNGINVNAAQWMKLEPCPHDTKSH